LAGGWGFGERQAPPEENPETLRLTSTPVLPLWRTAPVAGPPTDHATACRHHCESPASQSTEEKYCMGTRQRRVQLGSDPAALPMVAEVEAELARRGLTVEVRNGTPSPEVTKALAHISRERLCQRPVISWAFGPRRPERRGWEGYP
jgi:hypothetical protein